ncbi:MAG: right-handed parallel beta-helix repeat-containing protein, partial [Desulfurococcaceae archaeon]
MKKLFSLILSLMAGFIASCGGGYGGDSSTSSASALFGDGPKALKPAQAQCTITVEDYDRNGSIDNADIQTALNTARENNQDDVVCIPAGTYNITNTLTYNLSSNSSECGKKLTIRAVGGDVILDGGNSVRILSIHTSSCSDDANGDITIEGITFQNGESSSGSGGGLFVSVVKANITLTNNTFSNNSAYYGGGAYAYSDSGSVTLTNNTFSNNISGYGGGAYAYSDSGSVTLTNNTFSNNSAYHGGGASAWSQTGSVTLTNNTFSNNHANYGGGGGAYAYSLSGSVTLTNNTFSNNTASGGGGGAYAYSLSGSVTLTNNTFSNNTASGGGGVSAWSQTGSVTLTNNTFSNNTASGGGGASAWSQTGSVTLTNNTFSGNNAGYEGGGAYVGSDSGSITLTNNTFSSNNAGYEGGGAYVRLYYNAATLHFYNNILWNNTANANGDDLYVDNDGDEDNTPSPVNLAHNLFS